MKRQPDLIDQFTDLVVGADDPRALAEDAGGCDGAEQRSERGDLPATNKGMTLHASRGIDQTVLDAMETVWARRKDSLRDGEVFYVPDRRSQRRLPKEQRDVGATSFVVVPVFADKDDLVALLYVDSRDPHFCEPYDIERLAKLPASWRRPSAARFPRPVESSEGSWQSYLERTPMEDVEREKLLLLLNRNEWNISRVARLMGVTRRTIYVRLARHEIPREKVSKTRRRLAPA